MSQDTNLRLNFPVTVQADGTAQVRISPTWGDPWSLTQVSCAIPDAPSGATGVAKVNGSFLSYFIATGDVLAGDPPLELAPGDVLTLDWAVCTPGQVGTVLVQYDKVKYR